MRLREKFIVLTALSGLLVAIVSIVGYYNASTNLEESVEQELIATVTAQENQLEGWLSSKAEVATAAANLMTSYKGNTALIESPESLSLADGDKDILELGVGTETGFFQGRQAGNKTGSLDPRTRDWYKLGHEKGQTAFTEAYVDKFTNKLVTSAVSPFQVNGQFGGTIFVDILLETLDQQAKDVNYRGVGRATFVEPSGVILATSGPAEKMSNFKELPGIGKHFDEMVKNQKGFFQVEGSGDEGDTVVAYSTVGASGWLVALEVPQDAVFGTLTRMKFMYAILTLAGIVLMGFMCRQLSNGIVGPVSELEAHAKELSEGNLRLEDVQVSTNDEVGSLAVAFNNMSHNLRTLIKNMAKTSEQVAASAQELTASSHQSAEASVHVAETVGDVSAGMGQQLQDIDGAKENVDLVFKDITEMAGKAKTVAESSVQTAAAAKTGADMMESAIKKMGVIEQGVLESAEVVKKLGENSQQIGQIVEAISSIAEQTNLLSLNAAIEAARAGEHGRGFAVVAEEVRKLAAESQTSAEQIKERIASIQTDTAKAVESMERGSEGVKEGTKSIREVGAQFSDIMSMVESINAQMTAINSSVKLVSDGANNIVTAVDSIDNVSRKTADNTQTISSATQEQSASNEEIAAASQALAKLAEEMQAAIGKFKV